MSASWHRRGMPFGYVISTAVMAAVTWSAIAGHRPRQSSPFRLSGILRFPLNWPLAVILLLAASTALAIGQGGAHSPGFWVGFGLAVLASAGLVVLHRRARGTQAVVERALDEGLGPGWGAGADDRFRVRRVANVRYGPAGRRNLLDLYRDRSARAGRPVLIYLHAGAFRFGGKRFGARHLLRRLASHGWVCVSANYRFTKFPDPLVDVKKVIAWVREHGHEYGADPATVFVAGGSAGAHLASMAALTDTSVAGFIGLYGYYGPVDSYIDSEAPPAFVVHGDADTIVIVEDARRFVEQLRATSSNPVVYAELPGAQHGFDFFRSRRLDTVIDAIEAFAAWTRARAGRGAPCRA